MTRSERELAAKQAGLTADHAFMIACRRAGIAVEAAYLTPLVSIALAESETENARRQSAGAICGNE